MLQRLLLYNWVSFSGNFGKFRRASPPVPNRNPSLGRVKRFQFQFFNFLRRVCLLHWTPYKQKTNRNIYWFVLSLSRIFIDIQTNINFGNIFFFSFYNCKQPSFDLTRYSTILSCSSSNTNSLNLCLLKSTGKWLVYSTQNGHFYAYIHELHVVLESLTTGIIAWVVVCSLKTKW